MTDFKTLEFRSENGIATITLNRPDAANGLNPELGAELIESANLCDNDPSVRAVVLSANGRFFSVGGDIKAMAGFSDDVGKGIKALADGLHRAISTFARMKAPLIVAVNGMAAGAGFSIAIAADYVIASDAAAFTMAYSKAGLSPDGSSSYYLPRLIGLRRAQELMLTNRVLSAAEAQDWGLINAVVPADELAAEADKIAQTIIAASPESNHCIKQLLLASFDNGPETQMELEGRFIAACAASDNGREGVAAFLDKRKPEFK